MSLTNGTMTPPPSQTPTMVNNQAQNSTPTLQHQQQLPVGQQVLITQQQQQGPAGPAVGKSITVAQKSSPSIVQQPQGALMMNTMVNVTANNNTNNNSAVNANNNVTANLQMVRPGMSMATSLHSTMVTTATGQQFQIAHPAGHQPGGAIVLGARPPSMAPGTPVRFVQEPSGLFRGAVGTPTGAGAATSRPALSGGQAVLTPSPSGKGQRLVMANTARLPIIRQAAPNTFSPITMQNYMRGGLLVKNENGGYSIMQMSGAPPGGIRLAQMPPGSTPGATGTGATGPGTPIRTQLPGGQIVMAHQMAPGSTPATMGNKTVVVQQQAPSSGAGATTATLSSSAGGGQTTAAAAASVASSGAAHPTILSTPSQPLQPLTVQTASANAQAANAAPSQMSPNTAKKKCKNFLSTLIRLASDQPENVATNVKALIQGLIDDTIQPEEFTTSLQRELNSSPQPCLVPFLKKSLPYLRYSLMREEMTIEGVRAPPTSVMSIPGALPGSGGPGPGGQQQQLGGPMQGQIRTMLPSNVRFITPGAHPPLESNILTVLQPQITTATPSQQQQQQSATGGPMVISGQRIPYSHRVPSQPSPLKGAKGVANNQQQQQQQQQQHHPDCASIGGAGGATTTITPKKAKKKSAAEKKREKAAAAGDATLPLAGGEGIAGGAATAAGGGKSSFRDDDDINDVAAMGGVNLQEESQRILAGNAENIGQQIRSVKDEIFLQGTSLHAKVNSIVKRYELEDCADDVFALVSHAVQERLKTLVEKLGVIAEHRQENYKNNPRYETIQDVKAQVQFLQELDRLEKRRHEEQEREVLIKAAKSRSKVDDPDHIAIKARAKEMQRLEAEEIRQREANETALQAIGNPKKRLKTGGGGGSGAGNSSVGGSGGSGLNSIGGGLGNNHSISSPGGSGGGGASGSGNLGGGGGSSSLFSSYSSKPIKKIKRVTVRDVHFLMEHEKDTIRSVTLYKTYAR